MTFKNWLQLKAVCLSLMVLGGCHPAPQESVPIRAVRTLQLEGKGGTVTREFSAEIRARLETRLAFRVPGKIVSRSVNLGDTVKAGQILAQLDSADLMLSQQSARAALVSAQAQASQATADFKRFQELNSQGFISSAQLERYQTGLKAAEAALVQARANASLQGNQASYSQLLAAGSGVVTSIDAEAGQVVGAGEPIVTVAYDGARDVVFAVPDNLGITLRRMVGQSDQLKVRLSGANQWVNAQVREVAAAADGATRTLQVKAQLVGTDLGDVNLGQTATASFNEPSRVTNGVLLPLQALVECQGQSCVWVVSPQTMTVSLQKVLTAEVSGNQVVIAQGLQAGQEVVIAGVHVLAPGQKIKRLNDAHALNTGKAPQLATLTN